MNCEYLRLPNGQRNRRIQAIKCKIGSFLWFYMHKDKVTSAPAIREILPLLRVIETDEKRDLKTAEFPKQTFQLKLR